MHHTDELMSKFENMQKSQKRSNLKTRVHKESVTQSHGKRVFRSDKISVGRDLNV